jgi:hypothetical protein
MKRIAFIVGGLLGLFVSAGFILPALAKLRSGADGSAIVFLVLGVLLGVAAAAVALYGVARVKT